MTFTVNIPKDGHYDLTSVACVDDAGAGEGDLVFCAYGSSARQSDTSAKVASDFSIYGVIDSLDLRGKRTYDKAKETEACSWQK